MQLLQLLTEQADRQQEVVELINLIKQAKPFFDQRGSDANAWLYRGVKRSEVPQTLAAATSPRQDRRPADTAPQLHARLDNRLEQEFGIKYRSTSTFVTSDRGFASDYGQVCVILPLGQFKYVYAKNTRDAYNRFRARQAKKYIMDRAEAKNLDLSGMPSYGPSMSDAGARTQEADLMNWFDSQPELKPLIDEWFEATYQSCQYTSPQSIMEGLLSGNEIMLHCDHIAVIPVVAHVHPDTISLIERALNAKFDLGMEAYPSTSELINLMLPYIFK